MQTPTSRAVSEEKKPPLRNDAIKTAKANFYRQLLLRAHEVIIILVYRGGESNVERARAQMQLSALYAQ